MQKIIEGLAREASTMPRESHDVSAVNEVVIRNVVHVLLRGRSPKYRLITDDRSSQGTVYEYGITMPGAAVKVQEMWEEITPIALKKVVSAEGRLFFARYLFAIAAFLPEHGNQLCDAVGIIPDLKLALQEVHKVLQIVTDAAQKIGCAIKWPRVYAVCSVKLLNALNTASEDDVLKAAYAVYTGPACNKISRVRDELSARLQSGQPLASYAKDIAHDLRFLSNFNPVLARHHKFRKKVSTDNTPCGETLIIKPAAVIKSLMSENGEWEHEINDRIKKYIRKHACVCAETVFAMCLLLNQPVALTEDNIEVLKCADGKAAYSFTRSLTFSKIIDSATFNSQLNGGILATKEGRELVKLLLFLHHKRSECSFAVCYSKLAEEIKHIAKSIQERNGTPGCMREQIAHSINDAFSQNRLQSNGAILDYGHSIASHFAKRAALLQAFVESDDYPTFVEFIKQSNHTDNISTFQHYLKEKRESDLVAEHKTAQQASRRRTLKFVRWLGETTGLVCAVSGMITMAYVAYMRFYNEKDKSLLSVISIGNTHMASALTAGIVLFSIGVALTVVSWISAKGAASAFRSIKSATLGSSVDKSILPCDNAEHYLTIPETGSALIGYIGSTEAHGSVETPPCSSAQTKARTEMERASFRERLEAVKSQRAQRLNNSNFIKQG